MTGPQHYEQAERLIAKAGTVDMDDAYYLVTKAQAHAILALTAATALSASGVPQDGLTARAWRATIVEREQ